VITGLGRAPGLTDPNAVAVTLYKDGEVLNQGTGRDVSGDQWHALLWLVNRTIDSGWTIEPGQLLITGAMGKPVPMSAGLYVADFGRFGRLEWNVE
jgi:2-keto-4-pentenoate hydratase